MLGGRPGSARDQPNALRMMMFDIEEVQSSQNRFQFFRQERRHPSHSVAHICYLCGQPTNAMTIRCDSKVATGLQHTKHLLQDGLRISKKGERTATTNKVRNSSRSW